MSYASEHPVHCAQRAALGCKASHPGGKWASMRADQEGWFHSYQDDAAYCPAHVPDWVPAWREKRAARRFEVKDSFTRKPAVMSCGGCDMTAQQDGSSPEASRALRSAAYEHARQTGHTVTVTSEQELVIEAVPGD